MLFCAQYGETSPNGGTYVYDSQFKVQLNSGTYQKIAEYIYFGYTMKYGAGLPSTTEAKRAACSTQQFVWEYIRDNITSQYGAPSRNSWNSTYMSSSIYSSWLSETESTYNNYHNGNVSFNGQTGKATIGESTTFTDTNGILASYPSFNQTSNGVTFNHTQGSNELVVTVDGNTNADLATFVSTDYGIYRLMPNGSKYSSNEMSSYMYFHFTSGSIQDLIFSSYVDPTYFNFNVQVESGKIALKKTDNNGTAISGCTFKLYRDEECNQEVSTGVSASNGTISFEKLKPGTYYIREVQVPSGYLIDDTVQKVVVESGKTTEVGFKNNEPTGELKIYKVSENGDKIEGAEFTVTAAETIKNVSGSKTYYTKGQTVKVITTNEDGIALLDNLPMGKYQVKETKAPTGYLLNENIFDVDLEYKNDTTPVIELKIEGVVNNEPTGEITIVKKDSETGSIAQGDATLENAVYKVYAAEDIYNVAKTKKFYGKGDLVATRTTDKRGEMQKITNLPLGHYIVKEEVASNGYLIDETEYDVKLTYEDQVTKIISTIVTSNENVKKQQIHIYKSGIKEQSGLVDGLEGAEFTIKLFSDVENALNKGYTYEEIWNGIDEYGNKVEVDSKKVAEAQLIAPAYQTVKTDQNGNAYTKELPYGKYITKETFTPKDYYSAEDFTFTISKDTSEISEVAQKVKDLYVNNEQMETYIKLVKKDKETGKIVTLTSATFQIKATRHIYDRGNGKIIYKKGETITQKVGSTTYDSFTTNSQNLVVPDGSYNNNKEENGTITTPLKLPVGSYEITEINLPDGFLKLDNPVEFSISGIRDYDTDKDGDYIKEVVIENEQPVGTIMLDKTVALRENIDTSLIDISDLSGIQFRLIAKSNIIDKADGSIIYKSNQVVGTYNLDKEGKLKIEKLPMGEYELQEIKTLPGLALNDKKYDIKFTQKDTTTKIYTESREIINDTTLVEFSKTDITGQKELEGAKLSVIDENNNIIDSWTSGKETHKIEGLIVGKTYTLREEIAPNGFVKSTDVKFIVDNTKGIQKVEMVDKVLDITKTDLTTGEELEGAELIVTDENGNEIDRWVSGKEPHHVSNLEEGKKYTLTEITCPYGYEQAESIEFKVTTDKETQVVEMKDMPILKNIKVFKQDSITKEIIKADFTFGIYEDAECTKLIREEKANKNEGTVTFEDLRYGTYYIKELKAPKGYQLSDRIAKVEIDDNGVFVDGEKLEEKDSVYSFTYYNDLIPKVQTGNEINYLLLFSSMVISLIGITTGIAMIRRKKQKNK